LHVITNISLGVYYTVEKGKKKAPDYSGALKAVKE